MMTATISEKLTAFIESYPIPANEFQKKAHENLMNLDFPTTRHEYWKYTRVTKIQNSKFKIQNDPILKREQVSGIISSANYLVIANGNLRNDLSNFESAGVTIEVVRPETISPESKINSLVDQQHIFTALNTTYFNEVISISVNAGAEMTEPLQLIFVTVGNAVFSNPRILVEVQKSASAAFVANFISIDSVGSFNNVVAEFIAEENATVVYDKVQNESDSGFHISTEEISQQKNSNFKINTITLDGGLVRNNINAAVSGENCETHMNAAIIAKGNAHVDNHTFVNHKVANCFSNENYKYVLEDKSTGVFNGRVIVQQHAQKINAYQKNANILLSDFAQINSKPELEIYADDVKCSHGSTTGQLDEDAVFYLQARGISKEKAKKLLVSAFIGEIIDQFSSDALKNQINRILIEKHNWTT